MIVALPLLLAMLPADHDSAVGPWAPHLANEPSVQWRMSSRASWRSFQARWGGRWGVRWDPRNATPRFLWAPGVPSADAQALVDDVARLAGVDPAELDRARTSKRGDRTITQWTRTWRGAAVEGDQVALVAVGGRVAGVWVQLTPIGLDTTPRSGEVVVAVPSQRGAPRLATRAHDGFFVVYRDRSGNELHRWDTRRWAGTVQATYETRTVGDALATGPARDITLTDASASTTTTADDGTHALSGTLTALLDGPTVGITRNGAPISLSVAADDTIDAGTDIPYAAATVLHHFHVVWDWLETRWPAHPWLGDRVPADVENASGACNAYYTGGTITFLQEYSGYCNDLGRVADVVYHETGHGIHDYILVAGTFAGDVSEGSADYVSATINDSATIGPNSYASGGAIRELETDKVYPTDVIGEVHNDGLIWGSFLWNLRADWGAEPTDVLFLGALEQGPTLTDLYEAVVLADDDDGDLSNGTPNGCELMTRLAEHGLGPGPIGVVRFDHDALGPQSSWAEGYDVAFVLEDLLPDCSGLDRSSVQVWYTLGDAPVPGSVDDGATDTADSGGSDTGAPADPWAEWQAAPVASSGADWTATIPRQLAGSTVRYFIQAASTDGAQTVRTDGNDSNGAYSFTVGDREALWCADFEAGFGDWTHGAGWGTDDWAVGSATGLSAWDPDAPIDGAAHVATAIDADYTANSSQWLRSGVVSVGTEPLPPYTRLEMYRWLTVEDALYDQATFTVNDTPVWQNTATPGGITHHIDVDWTHVSLDPAPLLDESGSMTLAWGLASDAGLEFGGWALDAVCVTTLADVPGHYRVRDLRATDDANEVTVTWRNPFIAPLSGTVLVRNADGYPTGPDDGEVLDTDPDPTAGEARTVVDATAAPGEVWYYAVFAASNSVDAWVLDVVDGQNADVGGVPSAPDDTADTGDTDDTNVDTDDTSVDDTESPKLDDEEPGCGCGAPVGAGSVGAWTVVAALAAWRRRRV